MRFPPSFIERLRNHFLISEVIGRRIAIKKHGREFQALCPFHNEKTPSFTINDEKGFYHCFGCTAHGDAISFVMKHERLSYPEAVEKLAREAGIPLPEVSPEQVQRFEREKTLYDVLEAACQWFERELMGSSGMIARDYIERRGLKPETVRQFRIGFAPERKTALYDYLVNAGFPQALQAEAGLISIADSGVYDRFRGRVIFPIRNSAGKVIAFGGRLLSDQKNLPKYLNSPETPLFKKGELLFNLDLAKRPAREKNSAVVMEGYMDVVSTAQSGIDYVVATLGTAVTPEHLRLLWQLAKEPVLCLDGDTAGKRAMMRAAEMALPLLKPGYSLGFVKLPAGEDPDTYVQKHGKTAFEALLQRPERLYKILWDDALAAYKKHDLNLPETRAALQSKCAALTHLIADGTVKKHYSDYFNSQLWSQVRVSKRAAAPVRSSQVMHMAIQHHSAALETLAQRLLKMLIQFPQLLHKSQVEEKLAHLDIRNPRLDALRNSLLAAIHHAPTLSHEQCVAYLHEQLPDDWLTSLIDSKTDIVRFDTFEQATALWEKTMAAYTLAHLQVELEELQENIGNHMDEAGYQRLLELQQAIKKAHAGSFAPAETDVA